MKFIRLFIFLAAAAALLNAQSFYVLTGVKNYDPIMANMSNRVDKSTAEEIKSSMKSASKELGVDISKRVSRVLAFIIHDISVGDTVGLKVELNLGEYLHREGSDASVFALTYQDCRLIEVTDEAEEFEEQLIDLTDEMIEKFSLQYREDNKKLSTHTRRVRHDSFASQMEYQTDYRTALQKAKQQNKQLMLFMTTNFCPWCRKMESNILSQPDIDTQIKKKMVPLMLNFSDKKFPKQFNQIAITPTIYVIDPKSEKIIETFVGYSSREMLLHFIK